MAILWKKISGTLLLGVLAGLVAIPGSGVFAQIGLSPGFIAPPPAPLGPTFSTIEVDRVVSVSTSNGITTLGFTKPGSSSQWQLRFEPGFRSLSSARGLSLPAANVMAGVTQVAANSPPYRVRVEGVFSWLTKTPGVYWVTADSTVRFHLLFYDREFPESLAELLLPDGWVISGFCSDVPSDGKSSTCEYWGEVRVNDSPARTYGLLRYGTTFFESGESSQTLCVLNPLGEDDVLRFAWDSLYSFSSPLRPLNYCTNPQNVRVLHDGSSW